MSHACKAHLDGVAVKGAAAVYAVEGCGRALEGVVLDLGLHHHSSMRQKEPDCGFRLVARDQWTHLLERLPAICQMQAHIESQNTSNKQFNCTITQSKSLIRNDAHRKMLSPVHSNHTILAHLAAPDLWCIFPGASLNQCNGLHDPQGAPSVKGCFRFMSLIASRALLDVQPFGRC